MSAVAVAAMLMIPFAHAQAADVPPGEVDARPATRPALEAPGEVGGRAGRFVRQMFAELAALDLSQPQREAVRGHVEDLRDDLVSIDQTHAGDRQGRNAAARERMARFRRDVSQELEPAQRERLAERMRELRESGDLRDPARPQGAMPATRPGQGPATRPGPVRRGGGFGGDGGASGRAGVSPADAGPGRFADRLAAEPAASLPRDLPLLTATGRDTTLGDVLAGHRPTVLVLGSWSAPSFRDRVGDLPWLNDQLRGRGTAGRTADVVVVYTRERHPSDAEALPRNVEDGVSLSAHASASDRAAAARVVRDALPTNRPGVTVVLDAMDDGLLSRLSGDTLGDHVVVVRPDGTVAARQRWFDPTAIPSLVADADADADADAAETPAE